MFKPKKLILLVSLLVVGMLLLAACGADEPTPTAVEQIVDTQATADAEASGEEAAGVDAAADAAADAGAEAEEPDAAGESSTEEQGPMLRSEVPRVSVEELKERLDNGETIVIGDTRSETAFEISHIAGAISTPESEVLSQLEGIPLDQAIILYCS